MKNHKLSLLHSHVIVFSNCDWLCISDENINKVIISIKNIYLKHFLIIKNNIHILVIIYNITI